VARSAFSFVVGRAESRELCPNRLANGANAAVMPGRPEPDDPSQTTTAGCPTVI